MSASFKITDLLPLQNSSARIPRLGFGVYRSPTNQCVQSCLKALDAGYRHIDTAQFYANEAEVGEALRTTSVPRDQIFVTTKILSPAASVEATYDKLLASVHKIGGADGYVDLFLIHSSSSGSAGRKILWQALEKLYAEGKTKSIGVSNFGVGHIEEMRSYAQVFPPHVNQIELHPWCQQRVIDEYCQKNGVIVEAYSPIVRNYKANDPTTPIWKFKSLNSLNSPITNMQTMWKYIHLTFTIFSWLFNFLLYHSFSKHYDHYFDETRDISLTTVQYKPNPGANSETSTAECAVCLCKIEEGEEIRELRCAHLLHKPCLDWWTGFKHATCPICRSRLAPPRSTQLHQQLDEQVEVLVFKFCSFSSDSDRGDRWWLR